MKIVTFGEIRGLHIPKTSFYTWTHELLEQKDEMVLPAKISMKYYNGDGFFNIMPTIIPSLKTAGIKTIIRNPNHTPSLTGDLLLYDTETNELLAVMDATYITAFRTGAMAAYAINTLAIADYSVISFIGLGNISRATLSVLSQTNEFLNRKINIKLFKYNKHEIDFYSQFKVLPNVQFEFCNTIEELVANTNVLISAVTVANSIIAEPELFTPGVLLVPVHTKGFQTCDLVFDKVIVDDFEHVRGFKYFEQFKECHELAQVLKLPSLGRNNERQRIIAYNVGMAIQDVYFAKKIYDMISIDSNTSDKKSIPQYWVQ